MASDAARIIEQGLTPQEAFDKHIEYLDKLKAAGHLTAEQYGRAWSQASDEYQTATERMKEASRSMAESNMTQFQRMLSAWGDVTANMDQMAMGISQSVAQNMTTALTSIINGSKSGKEAFNDMALSILNDISQIIMRLLIQLAISRALGMVTGVPAVPVAVMHGGGVVGGQGGASRPSSMGSFTGAARFAYGGRVPSSGETPIVAEAGETVLTREQAGDIKDRLGKGTQKAAQPQGQAVTIVNVQNPQEMERYLTANPNVILNVIARNQGKVRHILKAS
jgi:lambda family phage tail tape measure protein